MDSAQNPTVHDSLPPALLKKAKYNELSNFHIQSNLSPVSNVRTIQKLWKRLRENPSTKNGKISEEPFIKIVSDLFKLKNDDLPRMLFKRRAYSGFATRHYRNKGQEELISDTIDLHDIILALTLLSRIGEDDKLFRNVKTVIFELTDMDEDGCLTPEEIGKMFEVIEKIFAKESADLNIQSRVLLEQLSRVKARRCYEWAMVAGNLEAKIQRDEGLITFQEFSETLNQMPKLRQQLLPHYRDLKTVLTDIPTEKVYNVSDYYRDDFVMFRYELHTIFTASNTGQRRKKKADAEVIKRTAEAILSDPRGSKSHPPARSMELKEGVARAGDESGKGRTGFATEPLRLHEMKLPRASEIEKQLSKPAKSTLNPKSKAKDTDKGPKECPGIVKSEDTNRESRLPPGVWDMNPNASELYTREKPDELEKVVAKLVGREEARTKAVPKTKSQQILDDMVREMQEEQNTAGKDEAQQIDINNIAKKVRGKLDSIPPYPTTTWTKEFPPERRR